MEELGGEESEEHDAELSAMAWEVAVRGKSGREIGTLHENWATALQSRDVFDKAQVRLIAGLRYQSRQQVSRQQAKSLQVES